MPVQAQNINDNFFNGIYKDLWRKIIPNGLTEAEADFIIDVAGLTPGNKVLDIMCGYGRHALELAKRGLDVTAIDNLIAYIDEVSETASKKNLSIRTICSGALETEIPNVYDAIICMGNSFSFFEKEEANELLQKLSNHLREDGVLIINSWMIAEIAIKHFREKEWQTIDQYKYLLDYKFLFNPSRIESEHTILSNEGSFEVIKGIDYVFTLSEMETMFNQAGLYTTGLYATPRKKPFKLGDTRIYIIAQKK